MKKSYVRLGLALALAAAPAAFLFGGRDSVEAQGAPPSLNMVAYGDIPQANVGQWVIAIVTSEVGSITCGAGRVVSENGSRYVTRVVSDSAQRGCGAPGRPVSFYITPDSPASFGQTVTETTTWSQGAKAQNLSPAKSMSVRVAAPIVANDGVY